MIRSELIGVFEGVWPSILICVIILSTLRIIYIIKDKTKTTIYKELLTLSFIVYILCLFHVVTSQDNLSNTSNITPFKEIFRYTFGSRLFIRNNIGNIIMFMPYGFFVSYYLKLNKPTITLFLSLVVSISIETTQLSIGRIFDIDDIILNTIGGLIGSYFFISLKYIQNIMPSFLKKDWFYNIIVLLIFTIFLLYMVNYIELGV